MMRRASSRLSSSFLFSSSSASFSSSFSRVRRFLSSSSSSSSSPRSFAVNDDDDDDDATTTTAARKEQQRECWSCFEKSDDDASSSSVVAYFCRKCDKITHPDAIKRRSHYALLNVPERFSIDSKAMELSMKNLQKMLHPDKFSSGASSSESGGGDGDKEREYSEEISARVNEAYGKLRDPLSRAKYLFGLKAGAPYDAEEKEGVGTREEVPPELLFLVMEVREAIEDADGDAEELMKLKGENEERMEEAKRRVGEAFDEDAVFDEDKARKAIVELTYFERIRKELIERL